MSPCSEVDAALNCVNVHDPTADEIRSKYAHATAKIAAKVIYAHGAEVMDGL